MKNIFCSRMGFFRFVTLLLILTMAAFTCYQPVKGKEFKQMNLTYGDNPKQKLDIYSPHIESGSLYPVIVYVHGGGWMRGDKSNVVDKPSFFTNKGYVFVSVNYRLSPKVTYDKMANDVACAVKWVYDRAEQFHIDKSRINLMGHSAGGHLVTLVTANPVFLNQFGLSLDSVKSVVNLDGPINLVEYIPRNGRYKQVFGQNHHVWAEASPITYAQHYMPPMLLVGPKRTSVLHYVEAVQKAGSTAQIFETKTLTHREITKLIGVGNGSEEAKRLTKAVAGFLDHHNSK